VQNLRSAIKIPERKPVSVLARVVQVEKCDKLQNRWVCTTLN
jgi:hypothetical protein